MRTHIMILIIDPDDESGNEVIIHETEHDNESS